MARKSRYLEYAKGMQHSKDKKTKASTKESVLSKLKGYNKLEG